MRNEDRIRWDVLRSAIPEIDFVLPSDFQTIRRILEHSNIAILETCGKWVEIARLT